jgi:Tfp pilus assembly protein PilV
MNDTRGITLVETMVATLLLAVGLLGVARSMATAERLLRGAGRSTDLALGVHGTIEALAGRRCVPPPGATLVRGWEVTWLTTTGPPGMIVVDARRIDDAATAIRFVAPLRCDL